MSSRLPVLFLPITASPAYSHLKTTHTTRAGQLERLPKWMNCIPIILQWLWLSMRHASLTLPSAANPHITCGGMVGEGKQEYFDIMGDLAKSVTARSFCLYMESGISLAVVLAHMQQQKLHFPIVAKPNLGWCGYGVRRINNEPELARYINEYPKGQSLILQRYIDEAGEAGLFYVRHPGEKSGRITGVTLRYYPKVTGDGTRSIAQLIAANDRLQRIMKNKLHQPDFNPDAIPANGEEVRLATIGSTRVGGLYCDGGQCITPELTSALDAIARDMSDFHVGRFDVRYSSLEELRQGKGFTIMEVNGAGSESIHAWDPKYSIWESYRIIFTKQRLLFQIGAANRRNGHAPIGIINLARLHFMQQRLIRTYPLSN
jgi:hypothetical protein